MTKLNCDRNEYSGIRELLESLLKGNDSVHWIKIALQSPSGSSLSPKDWFSKGDFIPEVIETTRELQKRYALESLPEDWERIVTSELAKKPTLQLKNPNGTELRVGTLNINRVGEMYLQCQIKNKSYDEQGNQILSREDFLPRFKGSLLEMVVNSNTYCDPASMIQLPSDEEISKLSREALKIYRDYLDTPVGCLMVTKGEGIKYAIARKKFSDLRWERLNSRNCFQQSVTSVGIPTPDNCMYLQEVNKNFAPHIYQNPILIAHFGGPMIMKTDTFVVPRTEEKDYLERAIESMGEFNSLFVSNYSNRSNYQKMFREKGIKPANDSWLPTKRELIEIGKEILEIK